MQDYMYLKIGRKKNIKRGKEIENHKNYELPASVT